MKNQRLILMMAIAGIAIVILVGILNVLLGTKKLEIYNIDQVGSGLSSSEIAQLEEFMWESLQRTQGFEDDKSEIVVLVRPSSFMRTEKDGIVNYDFMVDVDEFRATYEVSFALMKGKGFYEAPLVECPEPKLMKYADTECKGEKTSSLSVSVGRELPHYLYLETGEMVAVTLGRAEDGEEYLSVRVSACGNETIVAKAREAVVKWASSLGYELDAGQIKIPEFCDGGY